ncbi:hypothetical protein [Streptomyces sp. NPDC101115]|uniref:hypothetical protein n=1 Tax=Streptomyces sp. NPDC101115 TaxID=3366106 RepID=UPI00382A9E9F
MTDTPTLPALAPGERLVPAHAIRRGDLVIATTADLGDGRIIRLDHAVPYYADPRPDAPGCGCEGHASLEPEDRAQPLVILYEGENWEFACDVVPADSLVVICRTAHPATGEEQP